MAKINLLPWRQELRQVRQREFFVVIAGVAVIAGFLVLVGHTYLGNKISAQDERNAYVQSEITKLNDQIQQIDSLQKRKDELLARMKIIEDLQGRRPVVVRVFDEFVRAIPDGVYLKTLERQGDTFKISGVAETKNEVSNLMRNLDASPWFKNPALSSVSEDTKGGAAPAPSNGQPGQAGAKGAAPAVESNLFQLTVQLEAPEAVPGKDQGANKTQNSGGGK
jgi:type IV pilus assembly protein PilN